MSKEFWSAVKGSGVGSVIGIVFGLATLSTMGLDRITFFEGLLLVSCAAFGGLLFGSLIGVTGAFRGDEEAVEETPFAHRNIRGVA
jgi:hypothetical protein